MAKCTAIHHLQSIRNRMCADFKSIRWIIQMSVHQCKRKITVGKVTYLTNSISRWLSLTEGTVCCVHLPLVADSSDVACSCGSRGCVSISSGVGYTKNVLGLLASKSRLRPIFLKLSTGPGCLGALASICICLSRWLCTGTLASSGWISILVCSCVVAGWEKHLTTFHISIVYRIVQYYMLMFCAN